MAVTRRIAVVEDACFRRHTGPPGHPERPERLDAVARAVAERAERLTRLPPRTASEEELLRVHPREQLELVAEAARRAPLRLDPDTYVSRDSDAVARLAAGSTVDLAHRVARGEVDAGLVAVRPPGHHAETGRAMGFCLLNNVAVAARALQADLGLERILVLDWDVHHGNGTQQIFEGDPTVLYFSLHQFPYYPGTGDFGEIGEGPGEGATVNVPLPAGCGDSEFVGVAQRVLIPVAHAFRPELMLVSCGFDAHADDPLASMEVSGAGFRDLARIARRLADELCGGRIVLALEGGYALSGLHEGTAAVLDVLLERAVEAPALGGVGRATRLARVLDRVHGAHGARYAVGAP